MSLLSHTSIVRVVGLRNRCNTVIVDFAGSRSRCVQFLQVSRESSLQWVEDVPKANIVLLQHKIHDVSNSNVITEVSLTCIGVVVVRD